MLRRRIRNFDFEWIPRTVEIFDKWDEVRWLAVDNEGELWIVWKQDYSSIYRYSHLNLMRNE